MQADPRGLEAICAGCGGPQHGCMELLLPPGLARQLLAQQRGFEQGLPQCSAASCYSSDKAGQSKAGQQTAWPCLCAIRIMTGG